MQTSLDLYLIVTLHTPSVCVLLESKLEVFHPGRHHLRHAMRRGETPQAHATLPVAEDDSRTGGQHRRIDGGDPATTGLGKKGDSAPMRCEMLRKFLGGLVLLLLGTAVVTSLVFYWLNTEKAQDARSQWPTAQATVLASSAKEGDLTVNFAYEIEGVRYLAKRTWSPVGKDRMRMAQSMYPPGTVVPVMYNPTDHAKAVIDPVACDPSGVQFVLSAVAAIAGGGLGLIGIGMLATCRHNGRKGGDQTPQDAEGKGPDRPSLLGLVACAAVAALGVLAILYGRTDVRCTVWLSSLGAFAVFFGVLGALYSLFPGLRGSYGDYEQM
jgi:hypothetical protein